MNNELIVIDGSDASGKATQAKLLLNFLEKELSLPPLTVEFPRYTKSISGKLLRECLDGEYGDFLNMEPRIASVLYAADRASALPEIKEAFLNGRVVVMDRYVSSNQIHQGGKIQDLSKRREFIDWLEDLEYGDLSLPKPTLVIFLDVPVDFSLQLIKERGGADQVEKDEEYLRNSHECASGLQKEKDNWHKVGCVRDGSLRTPEEIHVDVVKIVRNHLKL